MRLATLAFSLALLTLASPVFAESALVVVASDTGVYEAPVRLRVETSLRDAGWAVRPFGEAVVESGVNPAEILRCIDKAETCMIAAAESADVDRVLVIQLKTARDAEGVPQVIVTGSIFDGRTGARIHGAQRFCESCTAMAALVEQAGALADELRGATAGEASAEGVLTVTSTPTSAEVWIDGIRAGVAGEEIRVAPGHHALEARLAGHAAARREIDVEPGSPARWDVQLVALAPVEPAPAWQRYGKWAALGGGVFFTTLGIAWIAVDGPQSEGGLRQPDERKTMVPGVIATTVGVGLLGASGYLFYREHHAQGTETAPIVAPTDGGAVVGLSGHF